jgi:hypothetical protein
MRLQSVLSLGVSLGRLSAFLTLLVSLDLVF